MLSHADVGGLSSRTFASLADLAEYCAQHGFEHRLIASAPTNLDIVAEESGQALPFSPPRIIAGRPHDRSCLSGIVPHQPAVPAKRILRLKDARIIGWRSCLVGDRLVAGSPLESDAQRDALVRGAASGFEGYAIIRVGDQLAAIFSPLKTVPSPVRGTGLFLPSVEPGNYGSFLFRLLPKLLFLKSAATDFSYLIVPERTPWLLQLIRHLGFASIPVYSCRELEGVALPDLLFLADFDAEGLLDVATADRIQSLGAALAPSGPDFGSRLYVSRRLNALYRPAYRPMVNEAQAEAHMESLGFAILHPESLGMLDQAAIFARADFIVGPSGSGMLNAIFAAPGARVLDLESFAYTVRQHAKLYSSSGKDYGLVFGALTEQSDRPAMMKSWQLDIGDLAFAMRAFD